MTELDIIGLVFFVLATVAVLAWSFVDARRRKAKTRR